MNVCLQLFGQRSRRRSLCQQPPDFSSRPTRVEQPQSHSARSIVDIYGSAARANAAKVNVVRVLYPFRIPMGCLQGRTTDHSATLNRSGRFWNYNWESIKAVKATGCERELDVCDDSGQGILGWVTAAVADVESAVEVLRRKRAVRVCRYSTIFGI